jgi:RuvB-like protein 2
MFCTDSAARCAEEDTKLSSDALTILTRMATETTLRYALNLISCAQVSIIIILFLCIYSSCLQVVALKRKAPGGIVENEDLKRCYTFFLDEKRSVQWVGEGTAGLVGEEDVKQAAVSDRMEE